MKRKSRMRNARKENNMPLMALIDYFMIVLFFLTAIGMIKVISRPSQKVKPESYKLPSIKQNKLTYVGLAVMGLFLLF
jgi:hypothetical protein